jgi:hypothetical protein
MTSDKVQVEFTLTQDGRLIFKSCNGSDEIIYELTRRANEQALFYKRIQIIKEIVPLAIIALMLGTLFGLFVQVISRPSPEYRSDGYTVSKPFKSQTY